MSDTGPGPHEPNARPEEPEEEPAAGAPDEGERPDQAEAPREELAVKVAELEDRWRRALADLDNYRKRAVRVLEHERGAERARTSAAWLPVLDNLERALQHAEAEPAAVIEGVRSVLDQARQVIAHLGFPRRDDVGRPFDPARHEAVSIDAAADAPDGTVVQVIRPGYGDGDTQLRPAQVVVAQGPGDGTVP